MQCADTTSGNPIFIRASIQVIFRRYVLKKLDLTALPSWLRDRQQQPHIWGLHVVCTIVQVRFHQICVCAVAAIRTRYIARYQIIWAVPFR